MNVINYYDIMRTKYVYTYRGADKSLARPDFDIHISYL